MVRQNQEGQAAAPSCPFEDGRHHLLVDPLDGPDLVRGASIVFRLVGRLNVDQNEILLLELAKGVLGLSAVIRVEAPRRPGNGEHVQSRVHADLNDLSPMRYEQRHAANA
jgi:hypothetical protein